MDFFCCFFLAVGGGPSGFDFAPPISACTVGEQLVGGVCAPLAALDPQSRSEEAMGLVAMCSWVPVQNQHQSRSSGVWCLSPWLCSSWDAGDMGTASPAVRGMGTRRGAKEPLLLH